jgi:hypothetical protein
MNVASRFKIRQGEKEVEVTKWKLDKDKFIKEISLFGKKKKEEE